MSWTGDEKHSQYIPKGSLATWLHKYKVTLFFFSYCSFKFIQENSIPAPRQNPGKLHFFSGVLG